MCRAATSRAGRRRKPSALPACASSDSTSRRNALSPPHASSRNAVRVELSRSSASWQICSTRVSRSLGIASAQLPQQPYFRKAPVALHSVRRDVERLGGFVDVETSEKSQLHNLTLPR